jgi:hypothetical protein
MKLDGDVTLTDIYLNSSFSRIRSAFFIYHNNICLIFYPSLFIYLPFLLYLFFISYRKPKKDVMDIATRKIDVPVQELSLFSETRERYRAGATDRELHVIM